MPKRDKYHFQVSCGHGKTNNRVMDKTMKYQEILIKLLKGYVDFFSGSSSSVKPQMLVDRDRNHYQLIKIGWDEKQQQFVFGILFHFDIIDNKIWLQLNNTEFYLVDELVELGVPKSDIVLGFQPPLVRLASIKEKVA